MKILRNNSWHDAVVDAASCQCTCGCTKLFLEKINNEELYGCPDEYAVTFMTNYLGNQKRSKLQIIWNILKGKETWYSEVILTKENAESFFRKGLEVITHGKG